MIEYIIKLNRYGEVPRHKTYETMIDPLKKLKTILNNEKNRCYVIQNTCIYDEMDVLPVKTILSKTFVYFKLSKIIISFLKFDMDIGIK